MGTDELRARRNEYFRLLEDEKWQERKWKGPPQFENKSDKSLMMVCPSLRAFSGRLG